MGSELEKPTVVIGHFDAHGVLTTAARARTIKAIHKAFSSYPHTGPEKLADFIDAYFPALRENKVEIIDIPVNERDPSTYIEAVNRLSRNTDVTIYDHHKSDIKYATMITARLVIFPCAVEMADKIANVRKGYRTVLVDLTTLDESTKAQLQAWVFKTMEAIAHKHRADYVVAIAEARDRQTNRNVPTVQVIRYWLSNAIAPKKLINVGGLTVIGHEDAFSIRALDIDSARSLATNIFNDLEMASPRTTRLVNEQMVAQAVDSDFKTIINKVSQIAEQQSQLQKEIKEIKSEQEEIKKLLEMERKRPTLLSKATE
jgi:hypothetical protein